MSKIKVYQLDPLTKKVLKEHPSINEAALRMGCNESSIRLAIKSKGNSCGFKWSTDITNVDTNQQSKQEIQHKVLILDIETSPIKAFVWKLWKENVGLPQIISDWIMLTWACKWLGSDIILSDRLTSDEVKREDDKRIVKKLWSLLDEADIVIAHNGNSFDLPRIQTRFILHGLIPPSPYKQIDTKIVAKNQFGFTSNKLQHLANKLGIEGKYDTDFELWVKCLDGDEESLEYMEFYNKHDVEILEKVYLRLRPYIKGHPNIDIYYDDVLPHCPICGSHNVIFELDKKYYTQSLQYQTYRCQDCGGISRAKKGDKVLNKKVISSIPR